MSPERKCVHDIEFVDILEWMLKRTVHIFCRDNTADWATDCIIMVVN